MKFDFVECTNFLSYQHLVYSFKPYSILLQGMNKTDPNQESNGTGKTAFQALIEYCLYGSTSQKIRDKNLVRIGQKEAELTLIISCSVRQEKLVIKRLIKKRGSSQINLFINDERILIATVLDGNNFINKWIGISKDDLQNYYIINKERYKSFFYASNTEKIQIISRFSNADLIDNVFQSINERIDAKSTDLENQKLKAAKIEGTIEAIKLSLADQTSEQFEKSKKFLIDRTNESIKRQLSDIETQKKSIAQCNAENTENDRYVEELKKSIDESNKLLKGLNENDYSDKIAECSEQINALRGEWYKVNQKKLKRLDDLEELQKILAKIKVNLTTTVNCPKCAFEFFPGNPEADVEEERKKKVKIEGVCKSLLRKIDELTENLDDLTKKRTVAIDEEASYQVLKSKVIKEAHDIKIKISTDQCRITDILESSKINDQRIKVAYQLIEEYDQSIKRARHKLIEIKNSKQETSTNQLQKQKLKESEKLIDAYNEEISRTEESIYEDKQWILNFKNFKSYLANQFLQVIEALSNTFLEKLKSDLQIKWDGYKTKADGTVSEKITPYIIRNGEVREFNSFSGGERARMELAAILTIRELINHSHPYGGLDFMFTDEIFEGLDGLGLSSLMNSIKDFKYPILITTHVTDSNIYGNVLTVVKENGISKLYE